MNSQSSARLGLRAGGPGQGTPTANLKSTHISCDMTCCNPHSPHFAFVRLKGLSVGRRIAFPRLSCGRAAGYRGRELGWHV
jgi:hypothetical protein